MKSKRDSNLDYNKKLKDQGSKAISIVLSASEFEALKSYMELHSMSSYREALMSSVSYKFASFLEVSEIPLSDLLPANDPSSFAQFSQNGKAYEILSYQDPKMCRHVSDLSVFPLLSPVRIHF